MSSERLQRLHQYQSKEKQQLITRTLANLFYFSACSYLLLARPTVRKSWLNRNVARKPNAIIKSIPEPFPCAGVRPGQLSLMVLAIVFNQFFCGAREPVLLTRDRMSEITTQRIELSSHWLSYKWFYKGKVTKMLVLVANSGVNNKGCSLCM